MTTYIPTIHELGRKGVPELCAIFRRAAEISAAAHCPEPERAAARQTQENIRRVFAYRHPRP